MNNNNIKKEDIKEKQKKYDDYFNNMFKNIDNSILLDQQQREAVLLDCDNLLVVAGAGSGKTTTMVAKVNYLIDHCNYKEEEIIVISFTKKVKEELTTIIHEKFGHHKVQVETFHSLGLKIINAEGHNYKSIIESEGQYIILSDYIKNELFDNKEKFAKFTYAFSNYLYFDKTILNYKNYDEYHDYAYEKAMNRIGLNIGSYNDSEIEKRKKYCKTIYGEYVRSKEEVDIANFLFLNGIDYKYEKKYDKSPKVSFSYYPDFNIIQDDLENYIEHFGVDEDGENDMYTTDELNRYLKTLKLKSKFFEKKENVGLFIITYSKYSDGSTYLDHLKLQLLEKGYSFNKKTDEEVYEQLKSTSKDKYTASFIDKLLVPFINLFKEERYIYEDFDKLIKENTGEINEQLEVLKDFFKYYQDKLEENKQIDFQDMISKAYLVIDKAKEKNLGVDYKYLIIDEYQDISNQRFDLVKKLSKLFKAKVMAVGDDWQTIYGYAGSRIELFKNFENELEDAVSVPIEHTYRNSQELIDTAEEFILKNDDQIAKHLLSDKHLKYPIELVYFDEKSNEESNLNRSLVMKKILDHIIKIKPNSKVLLLGRYNNDIYKIKNDDIFRLLKNKVIYKQKRDLQIDFLTIHKAKGLGYDYCILLDLNDGRYGFPTKIINEPVMSLIANEKDEQILYPEERRLFYVALTRTKNKIYILVPKKHISTFAEEIRQSENVRFNETHKRYLVKSRRL